MIKKKKKIPRTINRIQPSMGTKACSPKEIAGQPIESAGFPIQILKLLFELHLN